MVQVCPSCQAPSDEGVEICPRCHAALASIGPGSVIASRYQIVKAIGRGGMGTVYLARDSVLDDTVALKVLRADLAASAEMERRFRSEIKLARRVTHPNVCRIHDYGEDGRTRWISMEAIEGIDLKHLVRIKGGLPVEEAFEVVLQIADGLQAIHALGIVHRDLKSPNIMVDTTGTVRLMDFGVAKRFGQDASAAMTATGQIIGTPEYMSPEQARGEKVDARSDIYAFGVVIYEVFTGHVPFRGDTPIATLLKHLQEPPSFSGEEARRIPPAVVPALQKMLAKDPAGRYASAAEVAVALRAARSQTRPSVAFAVPRAAAGSSAAAASIREPAPAARPVPLGELVQTIAARPTEVVVLPGTRPPRPRPSARRVATPRASLAWLGLLLALGALGATLAALGWRAQQARATAARLVADPPPAVVVVPSETLPNAPAGEPPPALSGAGAPPTAAPSLPPPDPLPRRPRTERTVAPSAPERREPQPAAPTAAAATQSQPAPPTAAAPQIGFLQVGVRPYAEVIVDGESRGTTPLRAISLPAGPHTVRLLHPDYHPLQRKVAIRAGETTRLIMDLTLDAIRK